MNSDDPLLKKAREAEARAKRESDERHTSESSMSVADYFSAVRGMALAVKHFWLFKAFVVVLLFSARLVIAVFKWSVFERREGKFHRDENGDLIFSAKRFGVTLLSFIAGLFLLHVAGSAVYFYSTTFEELVYTTGKQEIVTGERYQFTGCTSLPCSTDADNGKFYQIQGSWYFPYLVYPEEDVYANIPQQDGACYVKGYGLYLREFKALHRRLQWYQNIYNISCRPYTEEEKNRAVMSGMIPDLPEIKPTP